MGQRKKGTRKRNLYMVFIRYLLRFCVLTVILAAGTLVAYTVLVNTGIARLPTYEQSRIEEAADEIRQGGEEAALIPDSCRFGVYDPDGNFLYGTFEGNERQEGWERWKNGDTGAFYNTFYRSIQKEDGNLVIVRYQMVAKFSDPFLREIFPNAEFLILFIALLLFLTEAVLTARNFGRYLKRRLDTLTEIAAKVGQEDLDFEREYSDIREVDDVLGALFKMKEALQRSLEEQWESRRQKQEQIAALAHDIKTPLTIIRGNAELMQETESMEEIRAWDQEILDNAEELERYLAVLQETVRMSEQEKQTIGRGAAGQAAEKVIGQAADHCEEKMKPSEIREQEERFPAGPFLVEVRRKAEALGRTKNLAVECSFPGEEFMIRGRKGFREELLRAVGNVLSNGVDYSPAEQTLRIRAELRARAELRVRAGQKEISGLETFSEEKQDGGTFLQITVADSGPGFSGEALRHGTEQFYQADKSRAGTAHYGLGLYIARTVLEENGGALEIGNSEETGGGEVRIYVPCSVVSGETEDDQS